MGESEESMRGQPSFASALEHRVQGPPVLLLLPGLRPYHAPPPLPLSELGVVRPCSSSSLLREEYSMSALGKLRLFEQAVLACRGFHERTGMLHLDIKMANFLYKRNIGSDVEVKVSFTNGALPPVLFPAWQSWFCH
jgi:hypothetical protein